MEEVEYGGNKIRVVNGELYLHHMGIESIDEIKGLQNLKNLEGLYLQTNRITELSDLNALKTLKILNLSNNLISNITGLEHLNNLEQLNLNNNRIVEIRGLESLKKLKMLSIGNNLIPKVIIEELGGLKLSGEVNKPLKFVEYCSDMDAIVVSMVLDPIPDDLSKDEPIILYEPDTSKKKDIKTKISTISEEDKITEILLKIPDLVRQKKFIEALELLENAKVLSFKHGFHDDATEIIIKIQDVKYQWINFHLDNTLNIFKNSVECTLSDINNYLSSTIPGFNITESKLKIRLMSRINALKLNAVFHEDTIIFKDNVLAQQNLLDPHSVNGSSNNLYQPITIEKKNCIDCAESIDIEAKICPFCGIDQDKV